MNNTFTVARAFSRQKFWWLSNLLFIIEANKTGFMIMEAIMIILNHILE